MAAPSRILNAFDARSSRGILSRGHARYGVSNSPKPGSITNIQKAAQARVKKMQSLNDSRRIR
jgi:hypothetical protein